jgi:2,3-bisphosphoglycerate-independent phosphoglycerate mutase
MALGCLAACGKKEPARPAQEALAPKSAAVSDSKIESMALEALAPAESRESPKAELQAGLESRAEDILARYPEKNAAELLNLPEVNEALKVGLTRLSKDKRLQDQINNSAAMVAKMQGLSGEPGTVGLDLDIKGYDHARKSRMLQAVLSEDPKQIVRFVTEEVGEAAPELTYGGVQRASNGVAIKETPPPTK